MCGTLFGGPPIVLEAAGPVRGLWDRLKLEQVLMDLLSNAVKHGAGRPVTVRVHQREELGMLEVEDHGIGIAPEDIGRLFGRFQRSASVRHFGGLGLGLWIARNIVVAHGGDIRVQSTPGSGSTFRVELPGALAFPATAARTG